MIFNHIVCSIIFNIEYDITFDIKTAIKTAIMAITRTPTPPAPKPVVVDEKHIEALINKGGSSSLAKEARSAPGSEEDAIKTILLRTYESQVQEIDELLARLPKRQRLSRNAFIVEAIEERLKRDKAKRK